MKTEVLTEQLREAHRRFGDGGVLVVYAADNATRDVLEAAISEGGLNVVVRVGTPIRADEFRALPVLEQEVVYLPEVQRAYSDYLPPVKGKRGRVRRW